MLLFLLHLISNVNIAIEYLNKNLVNVEICDSLDYHSFTPFYRKWRNQPLLECCFTCSWVSRIYFCVTSIRLDLSIFFLILYNDTLSSYLLIFGISVNTRWTTLLFFPFFALVLQSVFHGGLCLMYPLDNEDDTLTKTLHTPITAFYLSSTFTYPPW